MFRKQKKIVAVNPPHRVTGLRENPHVSSLGALTAGLVGNATGAKSHNFVETLGVHAGAGRVGEEEKSGVFVTPGRDLGEPVGDLALENLGTGDLGAGDEDGFA